MFFLSAHVTFVIEIRTESNEMKNRNNKAN